MSYFQFNNGIFSKITFSTLFHVILHDGSGENNDWCSVKTGENNRKNGSSYFGFE